MFPLIHPRSTQQFSGIDPKAYTFSDNRKRNGQPIKRAEIARKYEV